MKILTILLVGNENSSMLPMWQHDTYNMTRKYHIQVAGPMAIKMLYDIVSSTLIHLGG